MKACNKCGETKPLDEFHKNCKTLDGHVGHCKVCQRAVYKEWCEANKERRAAAAKAWYEANKERHSAAMKARYEANKDRHAASGKAWFEANKDRTAARKKAGRQQYMERWPEKMAARLAVHNAITCGELTRQPCEICGNTEVHGHHDDYSKPLEVRWLCLKHHTEHHTEHHTDCDRNLNRDQYHDH